MKKSIKIAALGLAAFGAIAAPAAGAFADTKASDPAAITDNLTVTIDGICTFERAATGDGGGNYTDTMTANDLNADFGTSKFIVKCNNKSGYKIAAEFSGLTGPETIAYSQTTPTKGSGSWTAKLTGGTDNLAATNALLANTSSQDPADGSAYEVKYTVSTTTNQAQGTYTGSAKYTLTQNS